MKIWKKPMVTMVYHKEMKKIIATASCSRFSCIGVLR